MTPIHPMAHRPDIPGLAEAVAAAPVTDQHKALLERVQCLSGLTSARLAHVRNEGGYLNRRKVLTLDGTLVHDDHTAWLETQLAADQGNAAATRCRLHSEGYLLTRCNVKTVYLMVDRLGPDQADFVQIEVSVEDESRDQQLFEHEASWRTFSDLGDLLIGLRRRPAASRRSPAL